MFPSERSLLFSHSFFWALNNFKIGIFDDSDGVSDVIDGRGPADGESDRSSGPIEAEAALDEDRGAAGAGMTSRGGAGLNAAAAASEDGVAFGAEEADAARVGQPIAVGKVDEDFVGAELIL